MRAFLTLVLMTLSLTATSAFAQDASAASLKQNMKQIGTLFKAMSTTINDSSKNQDNAKAADQILGLFKLVINQVPDAIEQMPSDQQAAAITDFKSLIQKEIDYTTQLENAFLSNDNAAAAKIYQEMKDTKADGHQKYNP